MMDIARILIGPLVWLAAFSAIYGLLGFACAMGWAEVGVGEVSLLRLALALAWGGAILLQIGIVGALYSQRFRSPSRFVRTVSITTGWVGLGSTLWTLFPLAATSSCA